MNNINLGKTKNVSRTKRRKNCDVLLMSATIPRTMMLTIYGDMDVSRLEEKQKQIADINISKPEKKLMN